MDLEGSTKEQLIEELRKKDQLIENLKKQLNKLELIFNHTNIGIVIGSANGKTLEYMNPAFAGMHGYTVEELTGQPIEAVFEPGFRCKLPHITELVHRKGRHNYECRHIRKDGTLFPVMVEAAAVYGENGEVLCLIVNVLDITERKNAEEALTKYQLLFENARDIILFTRPDGQIVEANGAAVKAYGYGRGELCSMNIGELRNEDSLHLLSSQMEKAGTEGILFETVYRRKDGTTFHAEVNARGAFWGREPIIMSVIRDITERKRLEEYREVESRFIFSVLEGLPAFVHLQKPDYSLRYVNRQFVELFGKPEGRSCFEIFHKRDQPCEDCPTFRVFNTRIPQQREWTLDDGRTYQIYDYPFYDLDGSLLVLELGIDITRRKQAEELLHRYQLLSENARDIIMFIRPDGQIIEANAAAVNSYGYSCNELLLMNYQKLQVLNEEFRTPPWEEAGPGGLLFETNHRRKDGSVFPVEVNSKGAMAGDEYVIILIIRDISERKLAENKLRESEEKYRTIFDINGTATAIIEEDGILSLVNSEFVKLYGCAGEEVIGKKYWKDFVHADELERIKQYSKIRLTAPEAVPDSIEAKLVDKTGNIKDFYIKIAGITGTKKIIVSCLDISKRKQAERALQESEEILKKSRDFYLTLLEEFPALIWCSGTDGKCNYVNKGWLQFTGRAMEQELGDGWTGSVHPGDMDRFLREYNTALEARKTFTLEYRLLRHDGQYRWVSNIGRPYNGLDGNFAGYIGMCVDITGRKKADKILQRYKLLSTRTRDIVLFVGCDGRIIEANNAAVLAYGYSRKELLNKTIYDLREPEIRPLVSQQMAQADSHGILFETMHRRKDGSLFPVEVSSQGADLDGGRVLLSIIRDITGRKEIEEALHKSETKYRAIFEASGTAMAIVGQDGLFSLVNMEFEKLFGYTRSETENKISWQTIVAGKDIQKIKEYRRARLLDPGAAPRNYEFSALDKYGNIISVYATFSLIPGTKKVVASLLDITARKQSEEALRRATQEKLLILNGISEIVLYYDLNMKILWANRAAYNFIGLKPEQFKGCYCHETFFNRCTVCEDCLFKEAVQTGKPVDGEIKEIRGRIFFIRGYPVQEQDGSIIGIVSVMMDLTERKQIENLLRESENKFKTVYEGAIVGIGLADLAGRIIECNKALEKMLGYGEKELGGLYFRDITHREDYQLEERLFREMVAGSRDRYQIEKRYRRKDGELIWALLITSVIKDGSGNPQYCVTIVENITERKLAEEALRASEEKFRTLFHKANDAIFLIDFSGIVPGKYIEVNDVACRRLGYSRNELLTMTPIDINPAENIDFARNFSYYILQNGFGITETVHVAKSGLRIPVEVGAHLFILKGKRVVLAIARDLTERKKTESDLTEARIKAERAERLASLGTLAAGIAHEINQPLNALKIITDALLYWHSVNGTLDMNEVVGELKKISSQADRIDGIIRRMRVFVRSEHYTKLESCSLNAAVEGALGMIGRQLSAHGIEVKKNLFDSLPCVWADKNRLEEMVINLVVNAMQALDAVSKTDKEISIATYFKDRVVMEVSDNAIGVDKKILPRIFEPFFTTKEVGIGMGLGLSIVHSIVSSYKGQINVSENQKGGATFRVYFPAIP